MRKCKILTMLTFIWAAGFGQSLSIANLPGGATWNVPTLSTTVTKAGKDYDPVAEISSASQTTLKVNALLFWTVSVQLSATSNWHSGLKIYVLRTGNGTGGAILDGGTGVFKEVTTSTQPFFTGSLGLGYARDNIPIQYKIDGLSVMLPVKTYTTTIQYTVSGL